MARLTGFDGIIGSYDKTHIPQLGVDRFVEPGQGPYAVYDAPLGRIGP
jgi:predicted amidohydrolase